ncbi:hypothetical protein M3Y97_00244000 [Aphelenchoides bicaudatus]|nr:hypothetical protein M3Y97_00244000 [Aphelenchoides bicaudatus]
MGSRQRERAYLQNNYLYRFPVDYTDLSARCPNEDDRFNGSNSSGSLLLRNDAIGDSEFDFHLKAKNVQKPGKKRLKKKSSKCNFFNRLCLFAFVFLLFIGVFFYWSMWLVKLNYKCGPNLDEPFTSNSTKFHWKTISQLLMDTFDGDRIRRNLQWLSETTHVAGTQEQLAIMDQIENEYRELGFKVKTYEYNVLLSYPDYSRPNTVHVWAENQWSLLSEGVGSVLSPDERQDETFVWWSAYSANGTVSGQIVYVNYGTEDDFESLLKANVQIKGRIILARFGSNFRGDKVALAQKYGAVGVILYSDPAEFAPESQLQNQTFPNSIWLPATETQRGTLLRTNGDPETPLFPSKEYTHRNVHLNDLYRSQTLPSIPVTPISYGDATKIFEQLDGAEVPWSFWKGGLPITYRSEGSINFQLNVNNRLKRRRIKNVVATWPGEEEKFVMLSNHVDSWTRGSIDPLSGTSVMLEAARVLADVSKQLGWRPRRTIKFCSWDAEEFGLIGSTEWVEEMLKSLEYNAVALINVDNINGNATVAAKSSPLLYKTLAKAASLVEHPNELERENGRLKLLDSWQFYGEKGPITGDKSIPAIKLPLYGSDFQQFISYVGLPVADIRLESAPIYNYAIYHSAHETPLAVHKFIDTNGKVLKAMGQFWLEVVRNIADSPIIPFDIFDYGIMLGEHIRRLDLQLRHLEIDKALEVDWYRSQFAYLETNVAAFQKLAGRLQHYIHTLKQDGIERHPKLLNAVNDRLFLVERSFIVEHGIRANSPMHRHVIFSPAQSRDMFPNSAFSLLLDPALKWSRAIDERERIELLEEIRMGCGQNCRELTVKRDSEDSQAVTQTKVDNAGNGCPGFRETCQGTADDSAVVFTYYDENGNDVGSTFGTGMVTATLACGPDNKLTFNGTKVAQVECISA